MRKVIILFPYCSIIYGIAKYILFDILEPNRFPIEGRSGEYYTTTVTCRCEKYDTHICMGIIRKSLLD